MFWTAQSRPWKLSDQTVRSAAQASVQYGPTAAPIEKRTALQSQKISIPAMSYQDLRPEHSQGTDSTYDQSGVVANLLLIAARDIELAD